VEEEALLEITLRALDGLQPARVGGQRDEGDVGRHGEDVRIVSAAIAVYIEPTKNAIIAI
jgi:hypothetical protein